MKRLVKLKKPFLILKRSIPFVLVAAVALTVAFYPNEHTARAERKRVVRIWNVDTFEGGKGSRTAFLKKAASIVEKRDQNVYYLISSYTPDGANAAFEGGEKPDILSFGVGLSAYAECSLPLPYTFSGGETEDGCLAYPWCRGEYVLFSLTEDFEADGAVAISCGGSNLPQVAAALAGIEGEEVDSLSAYVSFLNGNYRYLLGTQRDACRFASRGVSYFSKPLDAYCDLYQYISVLTAEKREDCFAFLDVLLSERVQSALVDIGMYPVKSGRAERTVSVFSGEQALQTLAQTARSAESLKKLDKYLKNI